MEIEKTLQSIREVVARAVVGKGEAVDLILTALLCGGHVLIEDVPGVGKTTLVRALAAALGASCFALGEPTAAQTFVLSEAKALAGSRVSATTSAEEITLFMETDHTSSIHKLPIL